MTTMRLPVLCACALLAPSGYAQLTDTEIVSLDAVALRDELAAGRVSAQRVTDAFLERIAAVDATGPQLAAVIEVNPDARAIARDLDRRYRRTGVAGPLHGVPVLVKANIDSADRMATTAGSLALAAHRASADAAVVARLRAAGAVLLGKTNLSEWANFRSSASTSGWSSLGGQTRNAYVLDRNPCGSSSGSAVAVAARLAPLALGTETDGSIVCPAAANGVVGVKPTIGLVSQRGIIPIAPSQDTAGPIARTVADAALLLAAITERGGNDADPRVRRAGSQSGPHRIGVVRDYFGAGREPDVEAAFEAALATLRAAGAVLVDPVQAALGRATDAAELEVLLVEFAVHLERYLGGVHDGPRTLAALIEFNDAHAGDVLRYFGQDLLLAAQGRGADDPSYGEARTLIAAARAQLEAVFALHDLDALVAPANGRAWRTDWQSGDDVRIGSSSIAAVSGHPSIAVPAALAGELPLGIAFIGRPLEEPLLFAIARMFEERRGPFPAPRFLPSIDE